MSFQSGQVKQLIRTYAVEIQTSDLKELDAEAVTMKLRRAMGANCKSGTWGSSSQFADPYADDRQKTNY